MRNDIRIRHITGISEFKTLKESWNTLLKQNHINDAFLTWEWLFSWWKVFNEGRKLWLITAWESNQLVGIAPLMLERRGKFGFGPKILCTLGTPMNDVGGFIIRNQNVNILDAMIGYIAENKKEWDILELTEFPFEGPEVGAVMSLFNGTFFSSIEKKVEHYFLPIETDWKKYYQGLSKKFRKNLRRAERNAGELGKVSMQHHAGKQIAWEQFETIINVNQYSNYPNLYASNLEQEFIRELLNCTSQWLIVYILYIDDDPVAYEYGFLYDNCFEDWRAGFDTRIDPRISIGKLLSLKVTENCFNLGCAKIDYMRGAHEYKTDWNPQSRHFKEIRIFRHQSLTANIAYLWLKKIKPVLKRS